MTKMDGGQNFRADGKPPGPQGGLSAQRTGPLDLKTLNLQGGGPGYDFADDIATSVMRSTTGGLREKGRHDGAIFERQGTLAITIHLRVDRLPPDNHHMAIG